MRRRATIAAMLALATPLFACGGAAPKPPRPRGPQLRLVLPALGGGDIDFAGFRGRMLLVHVFATWAMPVQDDAERIQRSLVEIPSLAVVGVALDLEGGEVVRPWRRAMEVTYPIALASDAVRRGQSPLGPTSQVPISLLYDADGRLLRRWDGPLGEPGIAEIRRLAAP